MPQDFVRIIEEMHGAHGTQWLDDLPQFLAKIEEKWALQVQPSFHNLSYHFVAPCLCADGSEAVLKLGYPEAQSPLFNEAKMLAKIGGNGAVRLLRFDTEHLVLLIEKLTPGENLKEICREDPLQAARVAIDLMPRIWQEPAPGDDFPSLQQWFDGFRKAEQAGFAPDSIRKARDYFEVLMASEQPFLLHGDLHHENILSAQRQPFLIIDPKGIIGPIGYEISVFLNNQLWWLAQAPNLQQQLAFCVRQFAEAFDTTPEKLKKWAFAQGVLSMWWTFEDNGQGWEDGLSFASFWET